MMIRLLPLLSVLLLAACGFHPVYGVNKYTPVGVEEKLALVQIDNIPDREGQYLRNELIDRFYREKRPSNPLYVLKIKNIRESLIDLDVTKSADATRGQLKLGGKMELVDKKSGVAVLDRNLQTITSYNILGSEFATRVTEENARQNALNDLARQIEMQLSLYFKRQ